MSETLDLSVLGTGSVIAPAGHGKTYSIGKTAHDHPELRILALTHTNAGVAALKRHSQNGSRSFRVETISSFCLRIARAFPGRAGWDESTFDLSLIVPAALRALSSPTVLSVVASGFDLIIVDEYQDCSPGQAAIIDSLAALVQTVIVGDPLQAIYDFGADGAIKWTGETSVFPQVGELTTPHRWRATNPALGEWLRDTRSRLLTGQNPDVKAAGCPVILDRKASDVMQRKLHKYLTPGVTTAIITPDSRNTHALSTVARSYGGRLRVAEAADFNTVRHVTKKIDDATNRAEILVILIDFLASVQTRIKTSVVNTLRGHLKSTGTVGRSRNVIVTTANQYLMDGELASALTFVQKLIEVGDAIYRPDSQSLLVRAIASQVSDPDRSLEECAQNLIDTMHHRTSWVPKGNIVGTTLRLKGLEFDRVVIMDPVSIHDQKHLYVALTRPSRELILVFNEN